MTNEIGNYYKFSVIRICKKKVVVDSQAGVSIEVDTQLENLLLESKKAVFIPLPGYGAYRIFCPA